MQLPRRFNSNLKYLFVLAVQIHLTVNIIFQNSHRAEVARRINDSLNDIVDIAEHQRVEKVLWKKWYLFIEPVATEKIAHLLRRQRSQYEYRRHKELVHRESRNVTEHRSDDVPLFDEVVVEKIIHQIHRGPMVSNHGISTK